MSESWLAMLPFKGNGTCKTRLQLPDTQALAQQWLTLALQQCLQVPSIKAIWVIGLARPAYLPDEVNWMAQSSLGLNQGLQECCDRLKPNCWLVLLPDLPQVQVSELEDLLAACPDKGMVLAPDRHGRGCNALAARNCRPDLVFGQESLAAFKAQKLPQVFLQRKGLAHDVDTLEDWKQLLCQQL